MKPFSYTHAPPNLCILFLVPTQHLAPNYAPDQLVPAIEHPAVSSNKPTVAWCMYVDQTVSLAIQK